MYFVYISLTFSVNCIHNKEKKMPIKSLER